MEGTALVPKSLTPHVAAAPDYVVYHGAHHDDVGSILSRGLERRGDHPTVTDSREGAELYAGMRDMTSPRVLEIHVPRDQVHRYLGEPAQGTALEGTVHALRETLPSSFIKAVHAAPTTYEMTMREKTASRGDGAADRRWYHGTRYEFQPGDLLHGGHVSSNQGYGIPGNHVYYSGKPSIAADFAHAANGPEENDWEGRQHVYQVEPDETHHRDPDEEEHADSWRSKSVKVVREVPWQPRWGRQDDAESAPGVKTAAAWEPSSGIFGPTTGLDQRLFADKGELRPGVRRDVMERLDRCIRSDHGLAGSDWQDWTRVYLTGGSVSEWAGSRPNEAAQDLDVIVGIDLDEAQRHNAFEGMTIEEACAALNKAFWSHFNESGWKPDFGGTWDLTAYANPRAWTIRDIKPYAAYNLTSETWAVQPPHLPEHSARDFAPGVTEHARAVLAQARAVLKMDEPLRTREARDLWDHVHAHRCTAFSEDGTGWDDPGNIDEKMLAYAPRDVLGKIRDLAMAGQQKTAALRQPEPEEFAHEVYKGDTSDLRLHGDKYILHRAGPRHINAYARGRELVQPDSPNYTKGHAQPRPVGYLSWTHHPDGKPPEIYKTMVKEKHRRKGVASAMLEFARETEPDLQHSIMLSEDARKWVKGTEQKTAAAEGVPERLYHGTPHEFSPGDYVHAASGWAHAARSPKVAATYALMHHGNQTGGHVYEVEPTGDVEKDERMTGIGAAGSWRSRSGFRVVREHEKTPHELLFGFPEKTAASGTWYHVTPSRLAPNQLITPMHGERKNFGDNYADSTAHAHFTPSIDRALEYRDYLDDEHGEGAGQVYEVQPTGPHEEDPNDGEARRSAHPLRVLRHVADPDDEADDNKWNDVIDIYNAHREDDPQRARDWLRTERPAPEPKTAAWDASGSEKTGLYLRFGHWPKNERSFSGAGGYHEDGVSAYDLDRKGEPQIGWEGENGNDPEEEMQGRVHRAESSRANNRDDRDHAGHLVTGEHVGTGYDGEPLLRNVKRAGDWIDHRHLLIPGAEKHRLARDPGDEGYEPPVTQQRKTAAGGHVFREAREYACPDGHTDPKRGSLVRTVVPEGSGIEPKCTRCRQPMVPVSDRLSGSWETGPCCTPSGPGGKWAGPRRDPAKCTSCYGTQQRETCTGCRAGGCTGTHDYCLDCDGTGRETCPECGGDGMIPGEEDASEVPCPHCGESGDVACGGCNGSGSPAIGSKTAARREVKLPAPGPATIPFAHNTEKSPQLGAMYGQDIEPHGKYITSRGPADNFGDSRWETGEAHFANPLHVEFGGEYGHESNWKNRLSAEHGGKTGLALSRALVSKGHDAIVTHDGYGMSEIVDLRGISGRRRREAAADYNLPQQGGMVYLTVPAGAVQGHPDGPVEHHVSLAYLSRHMTDEEHQSALDTARAAAARHAPFTGTLGGLGTFPEGAGAERKRSAHVPLHAPEAHALHHEFGEVNKTSHPGYNPHVTLGYFRKGEDNPAPHPQVSVPFTHVHVRRGDQVDSFPLTGGMQREAVKQEPLTYYHGHGRESRALTGIDDWDNAGTFVSHSPDVAKSYGPKVDRIEIDPRASVHRFPVTNLKTMTENVRQAREAGADVVEFHPPMDFVGHIILNRDKIVRREPLGGMQRDPGRTGTRREAAYEPPQMPPRQHAAHTTPSFSDYRRDILNVAKNPEPGTVVWRSEMRPKGEGAHPDSVGMHWTANPDQVIHKPDTSTHHTVVYQGRVKDPEADLFPRSHPMWSGQHRSMDSEAEVRFKPGAHVALEGTWKPRSPSGPRTDGNGGYEGWDSRESLIPMNPDRMEEGHWGWHPVGRDVPVRHAGDGAADYSGFGIHREAVSGYDGLTGRSAMIYLDLPPGAVRPVPGGTDEHHVTLVYLGKNVSDEAFEEACRRTRLAAARHAPMDGLLKGIDVFPPSKGSDGKVVAFVPAFVGGVGRLVRELEDLSASEHRDLRPHVTLAYLSEGDGLPQPHPAVPLRFDRVHVKRGDDVVSFPLSGEGDARE